MISDAIDKVGPDGALSIESSSSFETTVDVEEGMEKDAIKKMDMQASGEFLAELKVLTHVHHLNLDFVHLPWQNQSNQNLSVVPLGPSAAPPGSGALHRGYSSASGQLSSGIFSSGLVWYQCCSTFPGSCRYGAQFSKLRRCISRDEAVSTVAQKVFKGLYENASNTACVSAHIAMLAAIREEWAQYVANFIFQS